MREILKANDGMILTDGQNYAKEIYLAEGADKSVFYEITEEEYEQILEAQEMDMYTGYFQRELS